MICPGPTKPFPSCTGCPSSKPHEPKNSCNHSFNVCPKCIPYKKEVPVDCPNCANYQRPYGINATEEKQCSKFKPFMDWNVGDCFIDRDQKRMIVQWGDLFSTISPDGKIRTSFIDKDVFMKAYCIPERITKREFYE
jgi:hypothetical protein